MLTRRALIVAALAAASVVAPLAALRPTARAENTAPPRARPRVRMSAATARVSAVHAVPGEFDAMGAAADGRLLSPAQAAALERKLAAAPADLPARVRLLGYYGRLRFQSPAAQVRSAFHDQVFWFIRNHPETVLARTPDMMLLSRLDGGAFDQGEKLWLEQAGRHPADTVILGNAAHYCTLSDEPTSERLLRQAAAQEPQNPNWHSQLGELYRLQTRHAPAADTMTWARRAFDEYEAAYVRTRQNTFWALQAVTDAAVDAPERETVRRQAADLLRRSEAANGWDSRVNAHYANITLGRLALEEGDVAQAERSLLAAGRPSGPPSPALDIFGGPRMSLAQALLQRGERQTVLAYLAECAQVWKGGSAVLTRWTAQVRQGQTPDFGSNL